MVPYKPIKVLYNLKPLEFTHFVLKSPDKAFRGLNVSLVFINKRFEFFKRSWIGKCAAMGITDSTFDKYGFAGVHRDFGSSAPNAAYLCHPAELDLFGTEFEFHLKCSFIVSYDNERQIVFFTPRTTRKSKGVLIIQYPGWTA